MENCCSEGVFSLRRPPESVVAFDARESISWTEFQRDVSNTFDVLVDTGAERVALCFDSSYLFCVGLLACCYAHKKLVIPGNCQPQALQELAPAFDLMLCDGMVPALSGISQLSVSASGQGKINNWPRLDSQSVSVTLFTSGSSGDPKPVVKSLYQLESEVRILDQLWGEKLRGTRVESTVSHQHIYGLLFRVLWPLLSGRAFSVVNLEFPEQLLSHASDDLVLISSPALLKRLGGEKNRSQVRCVFSSGGPLSGSAADQTKACLGVYPVEVFGSTETGGIAYRQQDKTSQPWNLLPGVDARLNGENCLRVRAPHVNGDEWYQTADECCFRDETRFELLGRTDRIVKIEEKRVSLVETEKRLEQLEWIAESAVIPVQESRPVLYAVIVLTHEGVNAMQQTGKGKFWLLLRKQLKNWLEPAAIPRRFRVVEEVPLNSQGKRQVAVIEQLFKQENGAHG